MGGEVCPDGAKCSLLQMLSRAVPGCDVLSHNETEVLVLLDESGVPLHLDLHRSVSGFYSAPRQWRESVPGNHRLAVPGRIPDGRVRDHAAVIRDLSLYW